MWNILQLGSLLLGVIFSFRGGATGNIEGLGLGALAIAWSAICPTNDGSILSKIDGSAKIYFLLFVPITASLFWYGVGWILG